MEAGHDLRHQRALHRGQGQILPAQWKDFTQTNAAFFTEGDDPLGSPGGFSKIGPLVRDTAFVANYQLPDSEQPSPRADVGRTGQRRDRDWRWVAVDRGEPHPPISIEAGRTGRAARSSE